MSNASHSREIWDSGMTDNTSFQPDSVHPFLPIIPGSSLCVSHEWQSQTLKFFGGFPRAQKSYIHQETGP